jgi:hypothetical protein
MIDSITLTVVPVIWVALALCTILGGLLFGTFSVHGADDILERALVHGLVGVAAISWIGAWLAGLGLFRWWLFAGLMIAWIGVSSLRRTWDGRILAQGWPVSKRALALGMIVLFAISWLFARPAESFWVVDDSGVYTVGGILLARQGTLLAHPAMFGKVTADFARQFFDIDPFGFVSRYFGPFYPWNLTSPTLEIGFLPLPKVWSALLVWVLGPQAAPWAVSVFGVLAVASVLSVFRRLAGIQVALGATLLLVVSAPEIWFARYPISEIYAQAFYWGGLFLFMLAWRADSASQDGRKLAVWSALMLAGITLLRFEGAALILATVVFILLAQGNPYIRQPSVNRPWLVVGFVASTAGWILGWSVARQYLLAQTLTAFSPGVTRAALFLLSILLAAVLMWGRLGFESNLRTYFKRAQEASSTWLPATVGGVWILWGGYAIWQLATHSWENTFVGWLAQYWTAPGLMLSFLGALWFLWSEHQRAERPVLSAVLGVTGLLLLGFSAKPFINPVHPWAMRRIVPIILPVLALTSAGVVFAARDFLISHFPMIAKQNNRLAAAGGFSIIVLLALPIGQHSLPFLLHQEKAGLWSELQRFADEFPSGSLLLFDDGFVGKQLSSTMELVFDLPAFSFAQTPSRDTQPEVNSLISAAQEEGRSVFLVVTDGDLAWWPGEWQFKNQAGYEMELPTVRNVRGHPVGKDDITELKVQFDIYQVQPGRSPAARPLEDVFEIPIGPGSYPFFRGGVEKWSINEQGQVLRWTDGFAIVDVPWPSSSVAEPADFCLVLDVAAGREAGNPAELIILAEDESVFRGEIAPGFEHHILRLPITGLENVGEPTLQLRLDSDVWVPEGTDRTLGIMLYDAELLPLERCNGQ